MSIKSMNWAWEQRLPPNAKLILMALADAANDEGDCWPKMKTLAAKCCVSQRTVQRMLKEFVASGLLTARPRFNHEGRQVSNNYTLNQKPWPDNLTPSPLSSTSEGDSSGSPGMTQQCHSGGVTAVADQQPPEEPSIEPLGETDAHKRFHPSLDRASQLAIEALLASESPERAERLLVELLKALDRGLIQTTPLQWLRGVQRRLGRNASAAPRRTPKSHSEYYNELIAKGMSPEDAKSIAEKTISRKTRASDSE